ncbi:MAG: glycoside hydrolase [Firmicutes bacterium]|nr:glycoside hydrolase [Bacillota bacterium]
MGVRAGWGGRVLSLWFGVLAAVLLLSAILWGASQRVAAWGGAISRWDQVLLRTPSSPQAAKPVAFSSSPSTQPTGSNLPSGMVLGYYYDPGDPQGSLQFLQHYEGVLSGIIPFWYTVNADGQIAGGTQTRVLTWAMAHHLWVFGLVRSQGGPQVLDQLLQNNTAEERAIAEMLTLVESNRFDGINLDWEGIDPRERDAFSQFVQRLSRTFHQHGYLVTLSLPAEVSNNPNDSWTGAYDYQALGRAADLVMIMAYDQHWAGGPPGPIASPSWVRQVLSYTISAIPPQKVILGIPGYGYDWSSNGAVALSYPQAVALQKQYDPTAIPLPSSGAPVPPPLPPR